MKFLENVRKAFHNEVPNSEYCNLNEREIALVKAIGAAVETRIAEESEKIKDRTEIQIERWFL